jgi:hypothetical protein
MELKKCIASNRIIKELMGFKSERTVQDWLHRLEEEWCIKRDYNRLGKAGISRNIIKCLVYVDSDRVPPVVNNRDPVLI